MTQPHFCQVIDFPVVPRPIPRATPEPQLDQVEETGAPYWPPAPPLAGPPFWSRLLTLAASSLLAMLVAAWTLQAWVAAARLDACAAACAPIHIEGTAP